MATTITHGNTTIFPALVLGLESSQSSGNIVHRILNRSAPEVTYGPATLRTGTLVLLMESMGAAEEARMAHTETGTFTLEDPDVPLTLTYVPSGDISLKLDETTRTFWVLSVDFNEVA